MGNSTARGGGFCRRFCCVTALAVAGCGTAEQVAFHRTRDTGVKEAEPIDASAREDASGPARADASTSADDAAPDGAGCGEGVSADPGAGPVHYWPLDDPPASGVFLDAIGDAHGANLGVQRASGIVGNAGWFADLGYVRFGDTVDLGAYSFSLHVWFSSAAVGDTRHVLVDKGMSGTASPGNRGYVLMLRDGIVDFGVSASGSIFRASAPEPERNQWHQAVAVLEREQCRLLLYLDGELAATQEYAELGTIDTNLRFAIGAIDRYPGSSATNQHFVGAIDEVAIFHRALSASEIVALHERGRRGEPLDE